LKTIHRQDFIEVGSAVKVHGTKGELKFSLTRGIKIKEWAFLEFRGKPVPFYIESTKADLNDEIILKLQGIASMELASSFIGKSLLLPKKQVMKEEVEGDLDIEGFTVVDQKYGVLGEVLEIVEYPYQSLAKINFNGVDVLIPLVDAIIIEINDKKKTIQVNLPEGLLGIN
jgi:16S rRNA processing protein RimM